MAAAAVVFLAGNPFWGTAAASLGGAAAEEGEKKVSGHGLLVPAQEGCGAHRAVGGEAVTASAAPFY